MQTAKTEARSLTFTFDGIVALEFESACLDWVSARANEMGFNGPVSFAMSRDGSLLLVTYKDDFVFLCVERKGSRLAVRIDGSLEDMNTPPSKYFKHASYSDDEHESIMIHEGKEYNVHSLQDLLELVKKIRGEDT